MNLHIIIWSIFLLPIILILVLFNNPLHPFPVETSVFTGVVLATVLMFHRIHGINEWINVFNKGAAAGLKNL